MDGFVPWLVLGFVVAQRLSELVIARRNATRLLTADEVLQAIAQHFPSNRIGWASAAGSAQQGQLLEKKKSTERAKQTPEAQQT